MFPGVTFPISAGRAATLRAIEAALRSPEPLVFAVAQRQDVDEVTPDGLYTIGMIATIGQVQRGLGGVQLVLQGEPRGIALRYRPAQGGYLEATSCREEMKPIDENDPAFAGLYRETRERAAELGEQAGLPEEVVTRCSTRSPSPAGSPTSSPATSSCRPPRSRPCSRRCRVEERLRRVLIHVQRQIGMLEAQEEIKSQVQEELGERQREMYLREQMKAIQKELGEGDESRDESSELREKLDKLELPEEARKEVERELGAARRARPRVDGGPGHPHLPRVGRRAAVEQALATTSST